MKPPLLVAHDLARHYRVSRGLLRGHATVRALDGVSFALEEGRTLAVVGESGCGKSTLARAVTMIEPPTSGLLQVDGIDVAHASTPARRRLRPLVQMVFQNPYASLNPRKRIGVLLEEPLVIQGRDGARERRTRALDMMARVGLRAEHYGRYPHMFSGGQRQRIAIARALMPRPRLVVADEPLSALDVSIQAQVLNLMLDLKDELGIAYLFISHNLDVVRHIADDVLVMYLGRAVEHGSRDAIFARPIHPYTRALLAATPSLRRARRRTATTVRGEPPSPLSPPSGCAFHQRCPFAIARCTLERPAMRPVAGVTVACHRAEEILAEPAAPH
jgi:dipeptide transport system ATP-binding protein